MDPAGNLCSIGFNDETEEEELVPVVDTVKELYKIVCKNSSMDPKELKRIAKAIADNPKK